MSSISSDEYNKYIFELTLSDSQILKIFGSTDLGMLDCSDMTDEEINRIVDNWNGVPEIYIVPLTKEKE